MQNTLKPGTKLCSGKYRIDSVIGQGGFGITYRATYFREIKEELGSIIAEVPVAMKEYFFSDYCDRGEDSFTVSVTNSQTRMFEDFKRKLIKEAHIISGLQHPHIVRVLEVFEENNTAYVAMHFIQGLSLKEVIEKKGKLAEKDALKYITHIAQALDTVHRQNVLHLDVKPGNILIETATDKAFLIDFGASKRYDSSSHEETSTTPAAKSKGYAPPEQYLDGGVSLFSPATDVYALGATLYRMLTGTLPPESLALMNDLAELVPPRKINPAISINIEKAILKAMALKRKDRFQTCAELVDNLNLTGFKNPSGLDNEDEPTQIENEDHHWRNTTKTDTVAAYKNYLATFPKGKYATLAKKRIAEIEEPTIINNNDNFAKVETDIWEKIKNSTNIDDFKNYLQKYPNGKYTTEAKKRIGQIIAGQKSDKPDIKPDSFSKPVRFKTPLIIAIATAIAIILFFLLKPSEDGDWQEAQNQNNEAAYSQYLADYPQGKYTAAAQENIDWLQAQSNNSTAAYNSFVQKYGSKSPFYQTANQAVAALYYDSISPKLTLPNLRAYLASDRAKQLSEEYRTNAENKLKALVADSISYAQNTELQAKDEAAWKEAKRKNTKVALEKYIADFPQGTHIAEAKTAIDVLDWEQAQKDATINSYEKYLSNNPQGSYRTQAQKAIAELKNPTVTTGTVTDIDGNTYKTIKIGTQTWMVENLRTTKYNDGTAIPNVTDKDQWTKLTTGAYCWYDNNTANKNKYGALYNWYAVDTKKLAPKGWHVPTDAEWTTLINYLGGESTAGGKMKATTGWNSPNTGASNSSGFSAFPSGNRNAYDGTFNGAGNYGYWWSSTANGSSGAWYRYLYYNDAKAYRKYKSRSLGFAVRCLKD